MAKQKYDYAKLKQGFMQSDINNIKSYLDSLGIGNKINETKTKGWTKEKRELKNKTTEKAIAKRIEKEADKLSAKIPLERLYRMKGDFFDLIDQAIAGMQNKENVDIDKVVKGLNTIKTELGEPTTVSKNENDNTNKEIIQSINIVIGPEQIDKMQKR